MGAIDQMFPQLLTPRAQIWGPDEFVPLCHLSLTEYLLLFLAAEVAAVWFLWLLGGKKFLASA